MGNDIKSLSVIASFRQRESLRNLHKTNQYVAGYLYGGSHWYPINNVELFHVKYVRGLSGKYPSVFNISRTVPVALMWLGSQSVQTLLPICEQSPSRGASQSAVSCRWSSLCTVWPSYLQWRNEQISFITTLRLPILQLTSRLFWQGITSPRSVNPPTVQIWLPATSVFSQS